MRENTWGYILSAGFGTRARPLTNNAPKPTLEIWGEPIIVRLVRQMESLGIKNIIINLHYLGKQIQKILESMQSECRFYFLYEEEILGTAGAIKNACCQLNIKEKNLLVFHGDIVFDYDLSSFLTDECLAKLLCVEQFHIAEYLGNVAVNNSHQIIRLGKFFDRVEEVFQSGFFTGVHYLNAEGLERIKKLEDTCLVSQVYPRWLKEKLQVKAFCQKFFYDDLGSATRLFHANMEIFNSQQKNLVTGKYDEKFLEKYFLNDGGKLVSKTFLIFSEKKFLPHQIQLGPKTIIGKNVELNANTRVQNSVLMANTLVQKDDRLDCVVANKFDRVLID